MLIWLSFLDKLFLKNRPLSEEVESKMIEALKAMNYNYAEFIASIKEILKLTAYVSDAEAKIYAMTQMIIHVIY